MKEVYQRRSPIIKSRLSQHAGERADGKRRGGISEALAASLFHWMASFTPDCVCWPAKVVASVASPLGTAAGTFTLN
jgi:hypothetical protein